MKKALAALLALAAAAPAEAGQHVFTGPETLSRHRSRVACERALNAQYRRHIAGLAARPADDPVRTELSDVTRDREGRLRYSEMSQMGPSIARNVILDRSWRRHWWCAGRRLRFSFDGATSTGFHYPPPPPPPPPENEPVASPEPEAV